MPEVNLPQIREDHKFFDLLDPCLRDFVNKMPNNYSAKFIYKMQERIGVERTLAAAKKMVSEQYPGFTPI